MTDLSLSDTPVTVESVTTPGQPAEVLSTHRLSVGYRIARRRFRTVLPDLDLALRQGELVCLLGANGTGKSTLMRSLAALQPVVGGEVRLHGRTLHSVPAHQRARELAVVLTGQVAVGGLRGRDLVGLGRAPYTGWSGRLGEGDRAVVDECLHVTEATDLAERLLGELSDGERQRLMVARALAQEPSVVLLDEPTAFLDAPRRAELTAMLRALSRRTGIAALLSTHDVELALRNADRIWLVLPSGRVVVGAPEDLVLAGALQEAFTGTDFSFDALSGGFRVGVRPVGEVVLHGDTDELTATWTARALQRCGLTVRTDPAPADSAVRVDIVDREGRAAWRIRGPRTTVECGSLAELVSQCGHSFP